MQTDPTEEEAVGDDLRDPISSQEEESISSMELPTQTSSLSPDDEDSDEVSQGNENTEPTLEHRYLKVLRPENRETRQWMEVETPHEEVTITLADSQMRQVAGTGPDKTIVSQALWQRYVRAR